jgi:hypothetical protein
MVVPLMYRKYVVAQVRRGCDSGGSVDGVWGTNVFKPTACLGEVSTGRFSVILLVGNWRQHPEMHHGRSLANQYHTSITRAPVNVNGNSIQITVVFNKSWQ